jgi:mannose-P-dolichol utilization defect 1
MTGKALAMSVACCLRRQRTWCPLVQMLGIAILAGACIVKLPQIIAVWKSKSGEGLPLVSGELENYVYAIHMAYGVVNGLPITAYGEAAASWVQNFLLLLLLYKFKGASPLRPVVALLVVAAVLAPVVQGHVTPQVIAAMYDANSTIYLLSKLPQIIQAFQEVRSCHC